MWNNTLTIVIVSEPQFLDFIPQFGFWSILVLIYVSNPIDINNCINVKTLLLKEKWRI